MRYLGVDYGDVRTGLALSDPSGLLASGIGYLKESGMRHTAIKVAEEARARGAQSIVVGYPKNMDGSSGFRVEHTMRFKELLEELLPGVEIVLYDERMTTLAAAQYMNITDVRGKKRKQTVDAVAAVIILEDYLRFLNK